MKRDQKVEIVWRGKNVVCLFLLLSLGSIFDYVFVSERAQNRQEKWWIFVPVCFFRIWDLIPREKNWAHKKIFLKDREIDPRERERSVCVSVFWKPESQAKKKQTT